MSKVPTLRAYVVREAVVSGGINAALSALFVFLVFGGEQSAGLWGSPSLALDFVAQTFVIAFMATLVPGAIARKRVRIGSLARELRRALPLPVNLCLRALLIAVVVTLVVVPVAIAAMTLIAPDDLPFRTVLGLKVVYGAALGATVTSFALNAELRKRARPAAVS